MLSWREFQKPGNHPDFRKNALGAERPFSELWESSGVFSEQLSELEIPFSEYDLIFPLIPLQARFTLPPLLPSSVFLRIGVVPAHKRVSSKKPLTPVSKRVPGVHGKRGLERGWQKRLAKGWQKVGKGLTKGWHRVGEGLAKGRRVSLHPPNLGNSRNARLEERVCDRRWLLNAYYRQIFPPILAFWRPLACSVWGMKGGVVVGLGASSWEGRGWWVEGAEGDWRPDLANKSVDNNPLVFTYKKYPPKHNTAFFGHVHRGTARGAPGAREK